MNKNLCIIPARGGSKRIPRKNIKDFLGKPIIAYSIETALNSGLFDEVMVSTDDEEIKEIALQYGAKVPFLRSDKTSNDFATTFDVIEEVINEYKKLNKTFTNCCCIYPCAPFVEKESLAKAYQLLDKNDMVMPVVPFSFPIQRALKKDIENRINFLYPEHGLTRSQDLEPMYHDVGQFYWFDIEKVMLSKSIMQKHAGCVVVNELLAQDIDNLSDWRLAELKYQLLTEKNNEISK